MSFELLETLNNRPEGLSVVDKFNRNKINLAQIVTGDKKSYVYLEKNSSSIIETTNPKTRIQPLIAYDGDRNNIYITGPSGAGKSIIAAEFSAQYHALKPSNKKYYCCSTDIKDDRTWGALDFVTPIDINKIYNDKMSQEEEQEMIKTLFSESLICFDDLDTVSRDNKRNLTRFQGKIVEIGRKYNISCIIISHIVCGGVNTKMILNECNMYVTFKGMIKGNRLLKSYKGFTDNQLEAIKTTSWVCFNFRYGWIITPQSVKRV